MAGEEALGDLLACLKIAGRRQQSPYQFETARGQEWEVRNSPSVAWGTGPKENIFCHYEAAYDMEGRVEIFYINAVGERTGNAWKRYIFKEVLQASGSWLDCQFYLLWSQTKRRPYLASLILKPDDP